MKTYHINVETVLDWPLYKQTLREALVDWALGKAKALDYGVGSVRVAGDSFLVEVDPKGAE